MNKIVVATILTLTVLIGASQAAPITFQNLNGTGIILHPSMSFAYYYINTSLKSLSNVTIESHYIVISDVPIEFKATAETDIYINSFDPEHIAKENATIANFTVVPKYPDTDVQFYLGNLSNVPLIVYKDDEPFFAGIPTVFHSFVGNRTTINTSQTFYFADGKHIAKALQESVVNISEVSGVASVKGKVDSVSYQSGSTIFTVSDNTGSINVTFPAQVPVEVGKDVVVTGEYRAGVIHATQMWLGNTSGFSAHTYVIKVAPAAVGAPALAAPPAPTFPSLSATIQYASYTLAAILLFLVILLIVRKLKGTG